MVQFLTGKANSASENTFQFSALFGLKTRPGFCPPTMRPIASLRRRPLLLPPGVLAIPPL